MNELRREPGRRDRQPAPPQLAQQQVPFETFRPGVDIHWLSSGEGGESAVAVLRYAAGSRVPHHRHTGLETIFVIDAMQSDENGDYSAGTVVLNKPGSEHSVWSTPGCVVLIQWDRPIEFTEIDS